MHRRTLVPVLLLCGSLVLPTGEAGAATFRAGGDYVLDEFAVLEDDLYVLGRDIVVRGEVGGDLVAAGGTLAASGSVGEDAWLAGGRVVLDTDVAGDVRAAAGVIEVRGTVTEDLVVAAGTVIVAEGAVIEGDLVVLADFVSLEGAVRGNFLAQAKTVNMRGTVDGSAMLTIRGTLALTDTATLQGDLTYSAPREAMISAGATIGGSTNYRVREAPRSETGNLALSLLLQLLMGLVPALVILAVLPKHTERFLKRTFDESGRALLWGLVGIGAIPLVSLVLMLTVVGVLPGSAALLGYGVLLIVAKLMVPILVGAILLVWLQKRDVSQIRAYHVVLGFLVIELIGLVPQLGFFTIAVVYLAALGMLVRILYEAILERLDGPFRQATDSTRTIAFPPNP